MEEFKSLRLKLDWAKKHFVELDDGVADWMGLNGGERPYRIVEELHHQGGTNYLLIQKVLVTQPPPVRFSLLVSDILHNLRSLLDHLIEQLAERHHGVGVRFLGAEFPIFSDKDAFLRLRSKGRLKGHPAPDSGLYKMRGLRPLDQAIVKSLQPYHRGEYFYLDPLCRLQELSNIDKHRRFHLTAAGGMATAQSAWRGGWAGFTVRSMRNFHNRPLVHGTILQVWEITLTKAPEEVMDVGGQAYVDVRFDEAFAPGSERLVLTQLAAIFRHVQNEVLPRFGIVLPDYPGDFRE